MASPCDVTKDLIDTNAAMSGESVIKDTKRPNAMMEIFNLASTRIRNYKLTWKNVQNKITDGTLPFEEFVNDLNTYTSMSYQEF